MSRAKQLNDLYDRYERTPRTPETNDERRDLLTQIGVLEQAMEREHNEAVARMMSETKMAFSPN